jgi:hypothetical protein
MPSALDNVTTRTTCRVAGARLETQRRGILGPTHVLITRLGGIRLEMTTTITGGILLAFVLPRRALRGGRR